ncbi:MAG: phosphatidylserine decarboxylase family protein [Cytophagales bacterium]
MYFHKEGHSLILATAAISAVIISACLLLEVSNWVLYVASAFCSFFLIVFLQFFRNPKPNIRIRDNKVIAPADGKVVVIERTIETEYFKDERIQISIFMSPFNVHVNRNPVAGYVKYFRYHPGLFLVAWHPKASTDNERTTIVVENGNGIPILFRQIAGALAKRIRWYLKEGDQIEQCEEFGFIKFGSRVDIFLPTSAKVEVTLNQKTKGGETIIAAI